MSRDPQPTPTPRRSPRRAALWNLLPFATVPLGIFVWNQLRSGNPLVNLALLVLPVFTWGWGYLYLRRVGMYLIAVAVALVFCAVADFTAIRWFGVTMTGGDLSTLPQLPDLWALVLFAGLMGLALWSLATAVHAWRLAREASPA